MRHALSFHGHHYVGRFDLQVRVHASPAGLTHDLDEAHEVPLRIDKRRWNATREQSALRVERHFRGLVIFKLCYVPVPQANPLGGPTHTRGDFNLAARARVRYPMDS